MKSQLLFVLTLVCLTACSEPSGPPLLASDIDLRSPIAGRAVAPGYLNLQNTSNELISITHISSPQFTRIEIHETTNTNNVSRMRKLDSLDLAAGETKELRPGGLHLMLFSGPAPEDAVTLHFYAGDALVLTTTTRLDSK